MSWLVLERSPGLSLISSNGIAVITKDAALPRSTRNGPGWHFFLAGCPGGESPGQVGERADRIIQQIRSLPGDVLIFSSGHFLRVLAARWIGLEPAGGQLFLLSTASLSALSYEHNLSAPAIQLWDDKSHVGE